MSAWPDTMKVAPIREWPGELTHSEVAGFATWGEALSYLRQIGGIPADPYQAPEVHMPRVLRAAQRRAHPDSGGDAATFQRVTLAEAKLREAGML